MFLQINSAKGIVYLEFTDMNKRYASRRFEDIYNVPNITAVRKINSVKTGLWKLQLSNRYFF